MINGTRPLKIDHRDYDLHRTFGVAQTPIFPNELMIDAGLWMPNQNQPESEFGNPPLPYGCTEYTQSDLCADQDGILYNPMYLENIVHANTNGGADMREVLKVVVNQGTQKKDGTITKRTGFFNIKAYAPLDYFDAIRYAMLSGGQERRSVSWGTPWYPIWEQTAMQMNPIMPAMLSYDPTGCGWHNSKFAGWKTINGVTYLVNKSWQGTNCGENGWLYFSREVVNAVMQVPGTAAFTVTSMGSNQPIVTIPTTTWQWLISNIRNFLGLKY